MPRLPDIQPAPVSPSAPSSAPSALTDALALTRLPDALFPALATVSSSATSEYRVESLKALANMRTAYRLPESMCQVLNDRGDGFYPQVWERDPVVALAATGRVEPRHLTSVRRDIGHEWKPLARCADDARGLVYHEHAERSYVAVNGRGECAVIAEPADHEFKRRLDREMATCRIVRPIRDTADLPRFLTEPTPRSSNALDDQSAFLEKDAAQYRVIANTPQLVAQHLVDRLAAGLTAAQAVRLHEVSGVPSRAVPDVAFAPPRRAGI